MEQSRSCSRSLCMTHIVALPMSNVRCCSVLPASAITLESAGVGMLPLLWVLICFGRRLPDPIGFTREQGTNLPRGEIRIRGEKYERLKGNWRCKTSGTDGSCYYM
ncbi:hypothetical protein K461DRAFT_27084 [Myriangium duriaei CBS 260.36]|uniref:Uncharacterized protein n=1 Tax=Myriangium duriaei CBS 260.36 TaxID=1168546 RepID=A0A9P4JFK6_9PEZI|nr:hypothetical protein K461DRAFT_27084 [Myriangium duriaei CBS 260.36]